MKYEPVFGDQSLFDNAPLGTELVGHSGGFYKNSPDGPIYCGGCTFTTDEYRNIGFIAARRVIRTPTWTVEDHKAGRLPEVGCRIYVPIMFEEQNVIYSSEKVIVSISDNGGAVTRTEVASINRIKPIETPEEKVKRLEDEFVNELMKDSQVIYTSSEQLAMCRKTARAAYRKLSGALSAPTKGGE